MKLLLPLMIVLLSAAPVWAMAPDGCGAGSCADCHTLTKDEAATLLKRGQIDEVTKVEFSEMPGVWEVEVKKDDRSFPVYIDFSKSYVVLGNIVRLKDNKVLNAKQRPPSPKEIDVSRIPLDDAVLLGNPDAEDRVVVFTDPLCPFCLKLHGEIREVLRRDKNVAFLVKMFPLKIHGQRAYDMARAAVCSGSPEILDQSFALSALEAERRKKPAGAENEALARKAETLEKKIMSRVCETPAVEESRQLALTLGIRSTPTLIFPDGRVVAGAKDADTILKMLGREPAK